MDQMDTIYTNKANDGKIIKLYPMTPEDIYSSPSIIEEIKKHFTDIQKIELQDTMDWYAKTRFYGEDIKVIGKIGDAFEYAIYQGDEKVAELGAYSIGWWDESKRLAWCWLDAKEKANPNIIRDSLDYILNGKRVALIETPANKVSGVKILNKIALSYSGVIPNSNGNLAVFSFVPNREAKINRPIGLIETDIIESEFFKCANNVVYEYYVAKDDMNQPLGITGRYNFTHYKDDGKPTSWLGWTGVPKHLQCKGIGTQIIKAMINEALKLGSEFYCIETYSGMKGESVYSSANHVYHKKLGFVPIDLNNFFEGEPGKCDGMSLRIYSKRITDNK